jgi:D-aminoacyl-tRNA deacylase
MRAIIQRVKNTSVTIEKKCVAKIDHGLLVLLGIEHKDNALDIDWLANKVTGLRIFNDESGKMNRSVLDTDGEIIIVSQFTLHASIQKGFRPSFIKAAKPEQAIPIYNSFIQTCEKKIGKIIQTGVFGAHMEIALVNDGPVTILIDSLNKE